MERKRIIIAEDIDMVDYFWKKTKARIKQQGLTQAQFCERTGIKVATLQGWNTKHRLPDVENCIIIAEALNTSVEELMGRESTELPPEIEKVKYSEATRKIVQLLLPLDEPDIERVGFGVATAIGSMGLNIKDEHSANAG